MRTAARPLIFQSTLLMRGATRAALKADKTRTISIHAPHARSDAVGELWRCAERISIHAPHARSDGDVSFIMAIDNISIHAPHARSDVKIIPGLLPHAISIHAPHARSDLCDVCRRWHVRDISIHAPHARSDVSHPASCGLHHNFNPRSSCEERRTGLMVFCSSSLEFQSTLLMRGATLVNRRQPGPRTLFQSTLLMRGATQVYPQIQIQIGISIHAPHARSDPLYPLGGDS